MQARVMIDSCVFDAAHLLVAPPAGARPARELSGRAQGALLQVSTAFFMIVPLLLTALPASCAEFSVLRPQQSSVTFVSRQMGVPVEGSFRKFTANIAVDPAKAEAGTARIDIDLASIDTGSSRSGGSITASAPVSGATPIRLPTKYRFASALPLQHRNSNQPTNPKGERP